MTTQTELQGANDILQQNIHDAQDSINKLQIRLAAVIAERDKVAQEKLGIEDKLDKALASAINISEAATALLEQREKLQKRLDEIQGQKPVGYTSQSSIDFIHKPQDGSLAHACFVYPTKLGIAKPIPLYALPADQSAEIERLRVAIEGEAVKWDKTADFANACGDLDKLDWTRATSERLRAMILPK